MKKIMKYILLPLCVVALVGCSSGDKEIKYQEALDYSKKHFSTETLLAKYESVTYTRTVTVEKENAVKYKDDAAKTEKNQQVLKTLKSAFMDDKNASLVSEDKETTIVISTVALTSETIKEFFFGEDFLTEFNKDYSSPKISPTFEQLKSGGLRCETTYSKPFSDEQYAALDVKEGGIAVRSQVVSDNQGCIITTKGNSAVAVNVDGDDKNTAEVEFTLTIDVTFVWNPKAA